MNTRILRYVAVATVLMALGAMLAAQGADKPEAPAAPTTLPTVEPGTVVIALADGTKITAGEFTAFVGVLPPETQALAGGSGRRNIAEEFIRQRLLSAEARARKLDETPRFKQQLTVMADNILVGMLLQEMSAGLVNDQDVKKYYDDHKSAFERVAARHILISTMSEKKLSEDEAKAKDAEAKAKAEELRKRVAAKPEDFAAVAKAESQDPGSKDEGGDLQPFTRNMMVKEFEEVAFSLMPDEISPVVKTPFGYHIIQVKKKDTATLDEVKQQIADQLRGERFEQRFQELKKKADPKLDETYFGPPPKPAEEKPAGAGK